MTSQDQQPGNVKSFFRANPQVLALLVICLVLGLGTFLAVVFGLLAAGSDTTDGEPSGVVFAADAASHPSPSVRAQHFHVSAARQAGGRSLGLVQTSE